MPNYSSVFVKKITNGVMKDQTQLKQLNNKKYNFYIVDFLRMGTIIFDIQFHIILYSILHVVDTVTEGMVPFSYKYSCYPQILYKILCEHSHHINSFVLF